MASISPDSQNDHWGHVMGRQQAGSKAQRLGAQWEASVAGDLRRWVNDGVLADYQQCGPLIQRTGPGGRRIVIVEDEAPVDFDAWNHHGAWRFEAKATRAARWSLSQLEPHQARRLTSWHRPSIGRHAGIALAFFRPDEVESVWLSWNVRPDEVVSVWLPWDVLAVHWSRWAGGKARRGQASITVDEAIEMGSCWDEDMFR